MVEAVPQGDGIERRIQYASFRTDKAPSPGYSAELISNRVDPRYYDDLAAQPKASADCDTLLKLFKRNVVQRPNANFLGQRESLPPNADGKP